MNYHLDTISKDWQEKKNKNPNARLINNSVFFFSGKDSGLLNKRYIFSPVYENTIITDSNNIFGSVNHFVKECVLAIYNYGDKLNLIKDFEKVKECIGESKSMSSLSCSVKVRSLIPAREYDEIEKKWGEILYTIGYCAMMFRKPSCKDILLKTEDKYLFYSHPNDMILGTGRGEYYSSRYVNDISKFPGKNMAGCILMDIREAAKNMKDFDKDCDKKPFRITIQGTCRFLLFDYLYAVIRLHGYDIKGVMIDETDEVTSLYFELPRHSKLKQDIDSIKKSLSKYPQCVLL